MLALVNNIWCVVEHQCQQQHLQADAFVLRVARVLLASMRVRGPHSTHPIYQSWHPIG